MKKYLPLILAGVSLILIFAVAFGVSKSARLKKLRKADDPQPAVTTTAPDGTSEAGAPGSENRTAGEGESADESGSTEIPTAAPTTLTELPVPTVINMPTDESWSHVVINIFYQMNETYEPMVAPADERGEIVLDERVAEAYKQMAAAASADGVKLTLASGYVAPSRQQRLYDKQVETLMNGGLSQAEAALKASYTVLPPRCSEANYGLSVDIGWTEDDFASSPAYVWLRANAAKYGFVERYTADKEEITHFRASPWHWRYVGADAAQYMREYNVSLEEYAGKVN